jgi:signal transduction histidine kinase
MIKVKCLLVDDLEENLLVLQALLRRDDVELLLARSGVEALDLLLQHEVALALIDVQMPEMDGFELAELMRGSERTRHVPVIFVTAGVREQHRVFKGYDSGGVDFLFKPIEPAILRNKAEVFFQLYRQKRQLEEELQERTQTLRMQEMFAGVLGHDLRAPLSTIMTSAQLLPRLSSEPAVRDVAARLQSSGMRMTRMIEDLLDVTRARLGGGIPVIRRPADLRGVVTRAATDMQSVAGERPIVVELLGDGAGDWDEERLAQLITNLLGNAIQHGAGGRIEVGFDGRRRDDVEIAVINHGVLDAVQLQSLFDPFQRAGRDFGRGSGLGLGLFIARQIAVAHGGSLTASQREPDLVVFTLRLPRRAPAATA